MRDQERPTGRDDASASTRLTPVADPADSGAVQTGDPTPHRRVPTSGSLRKLLAKVLRGDTDLDAFCHDYHDDVFRRFSDGMERDRKVTLLLSHADRRLILDNMRHAYPDATARCEGLLEWEGNILPRRRWLLLLPVAVVVLGVAAFLFRPPVSSPVPPLEPSVQRTPLPPIEPPFDPKEPGVVASGPWLATPEGQNFCRDLKNLDPKHAVRCVAFPRETDTNELREKARSANASVLAEIDEVGRAQVTLLKRLESVPLLGGTFVLDLGPEADRGRAALLVNAVARLSGPRPDFEPDLVPCPELKTEALDAIALLTLLVVPSCKSSDIDSRRFLDVCGDSPVGLDETCALARLLDVEHNPGMPHVRANLEWLRDSGPQRFRAVAKLKLARLDCKSGALALATKAIHELLSGADSCMKAQLSEVAACIASGTGSEPLDTDVRALETLPIGFNNGCPKRMLVAALAGRGYWREASKRWPEATADYEAAYTAYPDPLYGLNLAEAWLHQKQPGKAVGVLDTLRSFPDAQPHYPINAALLRWIAARQAKSPSQQKRAAAALIQLHANLRTDTPGLRQPTNKPLRDLACPAPTSVDCVYDVLERHSSREELRRSLGGR